MAGRERADRQGLGAGGIKIWRGRLAAVDELTKAEGTTFSIFVDLLYLQP
jgi:hypothetical protein